MRFGKVKLLSSLVALNLVLGASARPAGGAGWGPLHEPGFVFYGF